MDEIESQSNMIVQVKSRTRGRKSKKTAYVTNALNRLKRIESSMANAGDEYELLPEWQHHLKNLLKYE